MGIIAPASSSVTLFDGKVCTCCKEWRHFPSFRTDTRYVDGHRSHCRFCERKQHSEALAKYRDTHPPIKPCDRTFQLRSCSQCGNDFRSLRLRSFCFDCLPHNYARTICCFCKKPFTQKAATRSKTCSKSCRALNSAEQQRGDKSHLWQGGKTDKTMIFRNSAEYGIWRTAVYVRDDYTCQMCHGRGGRLTSHHIRLFSEHPELALVVGNGITLCWPCHCSIKGRESEYEAQFFAITGGLTA